MAAKAAGRTPPTSPFYYTIGFRLILSTQNKTKLLHGLHHFKATAWVVLLENDWREAGGCFYENHLDPDSMRCPKRWYGNRSPQRRKGREGTQRIIIKGLISNEPDSVYPWDCSAPQENSSRKGHIFVPPHNALSTLLQQKSSADNLLAAFRRNFALGWMEAPHSEQWSSTASLAPQEGKNLDPLLGSPH